MRKGFLVNVDELKNDVVLQPEKITSTELLNNGDDDDDDDDDDDKSNKEVSPGVINRARSLSATRRVTPTTSASTGGETTAVEKRLANGDLYIGSFSSNAPHGSGKYLWRDGCMYEGEWRRGKASGKGKFSWPSGATFEGEFKSGRMEGFGTFTGSDGDTYKGSWVSDRKHGYGQKRYANGDFYEGNWKENLQDGQGRYVWKNGNEYFGEWRNGVISGHGVLIWANGNRYEGQWECGVPKGDGVFTWPDGSCYIGTWNCGGGCGSGKDVKLNGTFYHTSGKEEVFKGDENDFVLLTSGMRKRSSVDVAGRGSSVTMNFPRICIWESDGEAGDITCDIIDNVEASMIYRDGLWLDQLGVRQLMRGRPFCFIGNEVKKPGQAISKGHKNYDLMVNLQIGIR